MNFRFITDNREILTIALLVLVLLIMAAGIGEACRGGRPWAF